MKMIARYWILGLVLLLTSCEFIGNVFKGGMWVGAILVLLVLGGVVWIFSKFK